jgi:thiamine transport system permease protein
MAERLDADSASIDRIYTIMPKIANRYWLLWLAPGAFLALFYFYPLGSILKISFARGAGNLLAPFGQLVTSTHLREVIGFTFYQATLSTLLTLLFGLPGAYLIARYKLWGKSLILAVTGISFVLPTLVVATAFNALLGPRGWLNLMLMSFFDLSQPPLSIINSFTAILVAHVFYNTTIVLRLVGDFWSHIDPRMTQAAMVMGANRWQTLRHILLPLIMPAIASAALLIYIFDFTSFGVILVLGGPRFSTIEVEIYNQTISLFNLPLAAALSIVQLICTLGLTLLYIRLSRRISRPISLRPRRITERRFTSWSSRILATIYMSVLLALLTLPILALISRSFMRLEVPQPGQSAFSLHPTLAYYQELGINRQASFFYVPPTTAIAVSLSYAVTTVFLALAIGLPASWALVRDKGSLPNQFFEPLLMLPLGTSAVTLGLGFIVALDKPPLDLRASPILVPLAHTLVAFPFVVRSLVPSLSSIKPRLRQAAAVLGASPGEVLRSIDLPLIGRAILVAAVFAFTISLGEFGATALIARPEFPTIPVMIYRFISEPGALNLGKSLALSTILCLFTGISMLVIERFRIADIGEF